jgi:hypothetical protein
MGVKEVGKMKGVICTALTDLPILVAPSNYLRVVSRVRSVLPLNTRALQQETTSASLATPTTPTSATEVYPYKAEALYAC